jgi:hypothetical protein
VGDFLVSLVPCAHVKRYLTVANVDEGSSERPRSWEDTAHVADWIHQLASSLVERDLRRNVDLFVQGYDRLIAGYIPRVFLLIVFKTVLRPLYFGDASCLLCRTPPKTWCRSFPTRSRRTLFTSTPRSNAWHLPSWITQPVNSSISCLLRVRFRRYSRSTRKGCRALRLLGAGDSMAAYA